MTDVNIFEQASRKKLRFSTSRISGITVEDLWHMSLNELDDMAQRINRDIKASQEESFLSVKKTPVTKGRELALEIVKHVIKTLEAEREQVKVKADRAKERQRLIDLLAEAEHREAASKTPEQLRAELAALEEK